MAKKSMQEVTTSFFKDDHNRTVRVANWPNHSVELHVLVLLEFENDFGKKEEYVWVPYIQTKLDFKHQSSIEAPGYIRFLRTKNRSCPSYERTRV
jgi:hypothetical protein